MKPCCPTPEFLSRSQLVTSDEPLGYQGAHPHLASRLPLLESKPQTKSSDHHLPKLVTSPGTTSSLPSLNVFSSCPGDIISHVIGWMSKIINLRICCYTQNCPYQHLQKGDTHGAGARAFSIHSHEIQESQQMEQKKKSLLPCRGLTGRESKQLIFSSTCISARCCWRHLTSEKTELRRARRCWRLQRYFSYPWGQQFCQGRSSLRLLSWQGQCNFNTVPPWCLFWSQLWGTETI